MARDEYDDLIGRSARAAIDGVLRRNGAGYPGDHTIDVPPGSVPPTPAFEPGDAYEPPAPARAPPNGRQIEDEPDPPEPCSPKWPEPPHQDAYHGLAGEAVNTIAPETEADPAAVLVQFVVAFGNAARRCAYMSVGPRRHHGNLYCVVVGKTARARKGTAWSWVEALLGGPDPDWLRDRVLSGLSSREGLLKHLQDAGNDKRLLAVEEEFACLLRVMGRDGNTISAALRQAWDSGHLRTLTRNDPLRVQDAHFSLLGHITAEELARLLTEMDAANGLANRFLWCCARRSRLLPEGGDMPQLGRLQTAVSAALQCAEMVGRVPRSHQAAAIWRAEYPRLTADRPGLYGLVTSRAEAQVLRLSLVYALLDRSGTVEEEHLRAALALWDYCDRSVAYIFGEDLGNKKADELLYALKAAGEAGLGAREIDRVFKGHATAREIAEALGALRDAGLAEMKETATAGRPAKRWYACGRSGRSGRSPQESDGAL